MTTFSNRRAVAVGEAMVELAPLAGRTYAQGFAGDTFNTIWHMGQLLGPEIPAGLVTRIGADSLSDRFLAEMAADGLDTSGVSRDVERKMGLYLIELDGVERSFHYWREVSAARRLADDPKVLAAALDGAGLIHLSGITLAILSPLARETLFDALAAARGKGARVSFDPNVRPHLWASREEIRSTLARAIRVTDIALPSFDDEAAHWGDATPRDTLERFAALGVREVAVKNGAGEVVVLFEGSERACPTPPVSGIQDTTGAGDAFNAGYLAARLIGHSCGAAVTAGQRLSAEVIRTLGARAPKGKVRALKGSYLGAS